MPTQKGVIGITIKVQNIWQMGQEVAMVLIENDNDDNDRWPLSMKSVCVCQPKRTGLVSF